MPRARFQVGLFFAIAALALSAVPAINIVSTPKGEEIKWRNKAYLYNMDRLSGILAKELYPLGISLNPSQVVIGRDGWLFLGDGHSKTITTDRRKATVSDVERGKKIGAAALAWSSFLAGKGVQLFRIIIGSNKASIYSEYLPIWARPASPNATDVILAGADSTLILDSRVALREAKRKYSKLLYYKTDSHWNNYGAALAFQSFSRDIGRGFPELRWLPDSAYKVIENRGMTGGDLANILRISESLSDTDPAIFASTLPVDIAEYDYETMRLMQRGPNHMIGPPTRPLLIKANGSLNTKRVIWLRDSFGTALSPLMAATFSEVIHLHWREGFGSEKGLIRLVNEWKPHYVIVTVVEREFRSGDFLDLSTLRNSRFANQPQIEQPSW